MLLDRCFKPKLLPSLEDYQFRNSITSQEWRHNIKYFMKFLKLPWLPTYDKLFEDIYDLYNADVAFHNHVHVYDVFQLGICLLTRCKNVLKKMTNVEKFTYCIALLCHDIDHKGLTNVDIANNKHIYKADDQLFIREDSISSVSTMCSSSSHNEKHHLLRAICILQKYQIKYDELFFIKLISYTDLIKHQSFIQNFQPQRCEDILILLMKLADVGHILRPWDIHLHFVLLLNNEILCPLDKSYLPKDTISFNNMFTLSLVQKIKEFNVELYDELSNLYDKNMNNWHNMIKFPKISNKFNVMNYTI